MIERNTTPKSPPGVNWADEPHNDEFMGMTGPAVKVPLADKARHSVRAFSKFAIQSIILITEITLVAAVGGYIGTYLSAKIITEDCRRVGIAKVSDNFINCSIVEPKKDAADKPPR